jgi:hypothetical protein
MAVVLMYPIGTHAPMGDAVPDLTNLVGLSESESQRACMCPSEVNLNATAPSSQKISVLCSTTMDDETRTRLDNALQLLSLNGYSVFSLIDDILTRTSLENQSINLLRDGLERDAVDICARLLNHDPTSDSVSAWALGAVQSKLRSNQSRDRDERSDDWDRDSDSEADEMNGPSLCEWLWKDTAFSPAPTSGIAQCTYSSTSVAPKRVLSYVHSHESQT